MTTRVTVDAHAGWPVRVLTHDKQGNLQSEDTVPPNTVRDFYVHSTNSITVDEMPREKE